MPSRVERCYNIAELRKLAQRNMPAPMFHYIDGAADDEDERVRGESARDAGGGEQDDTTQEDAFVAKEVPQPSREQQEAAEGQHVGVDHPSQRGLGEPQVGLDGRQRHVNDVGVEHDHQVTEAEHVER